ncbi:MAG: CRISPR-associated helicase Cas3' [Rhodocyclaceae bacterium]|nr:CRISPR-associated helicase Cas3' [Rhodocyclaceae bacterium]
MSFIAHVRKDDDQQWLVDHLRGVGEKSSANASKVGLGAQGDLIGLLHDLGKYSQAFQNYIKSAAGLLNQDEDEEYVDADRLRGTIDHSTAGAQLIWRELEKRGEMGKLVGEMLALCVASHHSGLIDCLTVDGVDNFSRRMKKLAERTHIDEALAVADTEILTRANTYFAATPLIENVASKLKAIATSSSAAGSATIVQQQIGLLTRFLFSCLIDADRVDSADFETPRSARNRMHGRYETWAVLIARLESHLSLFATREKRHPIDELRVDISRHCLDAASRPRGIYRLTVPTGGGKTLASLRFALHHIRAHKMDRVIYVIPFTSIIDQNAKIVRGILEPADDPKSRGRIVLEHHGNLTSEQQGWREKMLTENWDAPVIYTTMVQLLESLFGAGTRGARRMHQLANAVIIFDEIQTLPINCVHMFNNAMNFLVEQCGSTVLLCTATQPLLDKVDKTKGAIHVPEGNELMPDVNELFRQLKRVDVAYEHKPGGRTNNEIAALAAGETKRVGSCLVIVNTKRSARELYDLSKTDEHIAVAHLSTSMCPAHRKRILRFVGRCLRWNVPIICFSTQLIEAGVDVDFGSVIRFMAGLDSIAQAAGRCNRHGLRAVGKVFVVNPQDENLDRLDAIRAGCEKTLRVFSDFDQDPAKYGHDRIGVEAMTWYYKNYFFDRASQMGYPVSATLIGRDDTLLNMLSANSNATHEFAARNAGKSQLHLRQSFMAAAKAFKAIDAPTRGIIVPYGKQGKKIIADLCGAFEVEKQFALLKRAQQYTVNVFPHQLKKLEEAGAVHGIQNDVPILHLDSRYYSREYGLSTEPVSLMENLTS